MDLNAVFGDVCDVVADAATVVAVGSRTHWEVGGPPPDGASEVRAPAGVMRYEPDDLTVAVGAGTTTRELAAVLGASRQECVLDPRDDVATVGGVLATGLSGIRRLGHGPLRDRVLEVGFVTADGRLRRGGGPTVKNVSGYDLPRLLVGSLGTLGVIVHAVLRCTPIPSHSVWVTTDLPPATARRAVLRPSAVVWDGATTCVLLEGIAADVEAERTVLGGREGEPPIWPAGPHRGRISVAAAEVGRVGDELSALGLHFLAETGVGTVHVAAGSEEGLGHARDAARRAGGWMLREHGAPGLDGFGGPLPNAALVTRIRDAFDPQGKLAPGRMPVRVKV